MNETVPSAPALCAMRQRKPRVLSEEQRLMLDIRSAINSTNNKNRMSDNQVLKECRPTNRDTSDLMLAFGKTAGLGYKLELVKILHGLLSKHGAAHPSEFLDVDAIRLSIELEPQLNGWHWDRLSEEATKFVAYVLTAGEDRELVARLAKERKIGTAEEIEPVLAEIKKSHCSLGSGAL